MSTELQQQQVQLHMLFHSFGLVEELLKRRQQVELLAERRQLVQAAERMPSVGH